MDPRKDDLKREGERRKGEAFANIEAHREVILLKARRAFCDVLIEKGKATIDDVRAVIVLPAGLRYQTRNRPSELTGRYGPDEKRRCNSISGAKSPVSAARMAAR